MPLSPGSKLGPYAILGPLGAGGMGEVYRATDTKLEREVAIKVLPAAVAQDPERLARFEREAKVLASLNHPNIAQIYGIEESSSERALVMELVPRPDPANSASAGGGPPHRRADCRGSGSRARKRHHPSRPETGEHYRHAAGSRQSARLRPRRGSRADGRQQRHQPR